jgi:hypothetical protein
VNNIKIMCAPGYPVSGASAARTVKAVHQVKNVAFQRERIATGLTVTPQNADLPSDPSATTSERRT